MSTIQLQPNQGGGRRRTTFIDEDFNFLGGIDSETPDLLMQKGRIPYARNARLYASSNNDSRIPVSTRKGPGFYSVPAGETLDTNLTAVTGAANQAISLTNWNASKYVATATGRLTRVDLNVSNTTGTGTFVVEIWSNVAGVPGVRLAQSSLTTSLFTGSLQYLTARFIEAPQVVATSTYWIVGYIQRDGSNSFNWSSTTSATTTLASTNSGVSWVATSYAMNYKAYVSTDSPTLGLTRYYRSTASPKTVIAHSTTLYSADDVTGALTSVKTGLSALATNYYFAYANDTMFYVNGKDAPRQWDGTTESAMTALTDVSSLIILHKNRLFTVITSDPSKVYFSEAGDFTTLRTSTNFFYVPAPKSTDPITGWEVLQDNLVIWTRTTKYVLYGSDLASFVLRRSTGKAGTVSQNTIKVYKDKAYFLADDGIYEFNGATDRLISQRNDGSGISREVASMANKAGAVAEVWNNQYRLYYASSGSGVNNRCLVYELEQDSWWMDDNVYVQKTSIWNKTPDSGQLLEASSVVGSANYAEQQYSDLGRQIEMEVRKPYTAYGNPAATKEVRKYRPQLRAASGAYQVDCQIDKDYRNSPTSNLVSLQGTGTNFGAGTNWAAFNWGITALIQPKLSGAGLANYFQYRWKCFGINMPVEILGYEVEYKRQRTR